MDEAKRKRSENPYKDRGKHQAWQMGWEAASHVKGATPPNIEPVDLLAWSQGLYDFMRDQYGEG